MRRVNIEGTRNILAAALQSGVRRMVYTSSIQVLQRPPQGVVIDESLFRCQQPGRRVRPQQSSRFAGSDQGRGRVWAGCRDRLPDRDRGSF